ncbi:MULTISPECIES: McrB family protein [Halomonas]|uniref:McrB family protein n=1 Tax=Halomonas TaxID=2745 RepID=UPI001649C220|nr:MULTISPECIES: AAA family ATPase [Halomonas]MDR5889831.1 AAA family ATPase [Halomonas salina]WJY06766.1 AAA family ATPase [Halomonas halophila]
MSSSRISSEPVRSLSAEDLGILVDEESEAQDDNPSLIDVLPDGDIVLNVAQELLSDGYSGVIFFGPPATGKSWYARKIAEQIVGHDSGKVRFVQFHPSYQYEDFVEGVKVTHEGGFEFEDKHFLIACEEAKKHSGPFFLVIDELSRCDPVRVFGEMLTYVEHSKRGEVFFLPSGRETYVPENLFILATMNPLDRGVDEVDMAFERRFAKIEMRPDEEQLKVFLEDKSFDPHVIEGVLEFFRFVNETENPYAHVGHAYFSNVSDTQSLKRLWQYQLRFHLEKAYRVDPAGFRDIEMKWEELVSSRL